MYNERKCASSGLEFEHFAGVSKNSFTQNLWKNLSLTFHSNWGLEKGLWSRKILTFAITSTQTSQSLQDSEKNPRASACISIATKWLYTSPSIHSSAELYNFLHLSLFMLYSLLRKHASKYFFINPFTLRCLVKSLLSESISLDYPLENKFSSLWGSGFLFNLLFRWLLQRDSTEWQQPETRNNHDRLWENKKPL